MGTCVARKDFQCHKTEKRAKFRPRQRQKQRELFKTCHFEVRLEVGMGDDCETGRRHGDPSSTRPEVGWGGGGWLSTAEASRSSEVSPPHDVTKPSGVISLHTPTSPKYSPHHLPPTILRRLSEDRRPGRDHRQGRRLRRVRQARLLAPITSHLLPLPTTLPCPGFQASRGPFCAHFVTTGLLPGSRPDIRHMSARRPQPPCPEPRASLRLRRGEPL